MYFRLCQDFKKTVNNILNTERVVSVKISSDQFRSNDFKFYFLCKTYSLVPDDFCNLSATRVFAGINQLGKSDGIYGFQFGNQLLATTFHRAFEFRNQIRISLIECNLVSYHRTQQVM